MIKERVFKAYNFSKQKHEGQKRKYSELDYFVHPKWVARTIEKLTKDEDMVVAALLHDVVEDTDTTIEEVRENFGERVAGLVSELTIDKELKEKMGKKHYLVFSIEKMSDDAFTIKLVDRLHNVLFLERDGVPKDFIEWYWKETSYILDVACHSLNDIQLAIIRRIDATLRFLEIIHGFKPKWYKRSDDKITSKNI